MKKQTTIKPDALYGALGAARFLECHPVTIIRHAKLGTLAFEYDSSGKRLFRHSTLEAAKHAGLIQYQGPRAQARTRRSAQS